VTTLENVLPSEVDLNDAGVDTFRELLARLSHQSVVKHFDAYTDIAWDSEEFQIDPTDPRWELRPNDTLGATAWYQAQPQGIRAQLGLELIVSMMKTGLQFESILKRGLLEFASELPNRSPEFRYAYHEVIEEAQHSLMFQEFINRSGFDPRGLTRLDKLGSRFVIALGRQFPPLFFIFVLGGEDPIDHVQRQELRSGTQLHPLTERIMRIHVTEEARHLSFARHYLKTQMPSMSTIQRLQLGVGAPLILSAMVRMMLMPSADLVQRYNIPKEVLDDAYLHNQRFRDETLASLRKVRRLCSELGILGPAYARLWRILGLWEDQPVPTA
jgi:P-aminobenzoate N-oxygenase AurF